VKHRIVLLGPPASGKGTRAEPVTDFYERQGILARVDADREGSIIFDELSRLVTA